MDRKKFLSQLTKGSLSAVLGASALTTSGRNKEMSNHDMIDQVGFNHLPNKEHKTMKTVLHRADTRGHANHGWLNSHHTFSFANYYNPERVHFGMLRVLNDDTVAPARGFGTHPHDNMEIISIPLSGDLEHKDSMGTSAVIKEGDIQVMSAGTGVYHSEYNANKDKEVKFLQIWVFPNKKDVTPRYDQIKIADLAKPNDFSQILSPSQSDQGVWIHQDAWFHIGQFDDDVEVSYTLKQKGNGVYAFVLDGAIEIDGQKLEKRDGFGMWDTTDFTVKTTAGSKVLLMEVPMN